MDMYINKVVEQNVYRALRKLGLERTLEVIEGITQPILRFRLKNCYFNIINKGGK